MNAATRSALRQFQAQHGLPVDGIAGPETEKALIDAKRSQSPEAGEPPARDAFEALELGEFAWEEEVNRNSRDYAMWVQSSLNKILGLRLAVDGLIGTQTRSAIRSFQQQKGLVPDGIVGPLTEQALIRAGASSPPSSAGTPAYIPAAPLPVPPTPSTGFLKDMPDLQRINLAPSSPVAINSGWPIARRTIASIYNRLGGLMSAVARKTQVEVPTVLAVWHVESGSRLHSPGKAVIRFENHLLYRLWGKNNDATYAQYFRHGGYMGQSGNAWENHQYREDPSKPFYASHSSPDTEFRVLGLAARLASEEIALQCISIGGPQILISHYSLIGYRTPREMYDAFQASERSHVLGFFDFCQQTAKEKGGLLPYLRSKDFRNFAYYYNGSGQVDYYSRMIQEAYNEARQLSLV
jgi:peptidoglycan hydrolase-like protein with peptidoglycan-binding domain